MFFRDLHFKESDINQLNPSLHPNTHASTQHIQVYQMKLYVLALFKFLAQPHSNLIFKARFAFSK